MRKIILLVAVAVAIMLSGCVTETKTLKTLDNGGFEEAEITGWKPFSCGQDDWFKTGFKAKNANGKEITGTVCCGLIFKDCTIRFS